MCYVSATSVGHREGGLLIILKRDLLRQHNVADWKFPFRTETPRNRAHPVFVQLVHVHLTCGADAIMLTAVAARYFEIAIFFILCELGRG